MPRGVRKTASRNKRMNYCESPDTTDNENEGPGLLGSILDLLINLSAQKKQGRKTTRRAPKRKQSLGGCDCPNCITAPPKKKCQSQRSELNKRTMSKASTSTAVGNSFNLDSDDDEVVDTNITGTQVDTIKNKVDDFFKALGSDEEELESKLSKPTELSSKPIEKKSKNFYTLLSDSEDEKEKPSTSTIESNSFSECSTSGLTNNVLSINSKLIPDVPDNENVDQNPEDLFAYVDNILNNDSIVDITNDEPKENIPVESLEDLKKKTEEILGSVTSFIDNIEPKKSEKKAPDSPQKEAPSCPICLEVLGGSRQAMSTFCGHMFCEPCIAKVAKTSKKCPTCRKNVTKTKYHTVYI